MESWERRRTLDTSVYHPKCLEDLLPQKIQTTHTPHIKMDKVFEQQCKRQRGKEKEEEMEEEEEENTWGCLARPKRPKDPAEPARK